jgi:hypothetical protein
MKPAVPPSAIKPCVFNPVGSPETDVTTVATNAPAVGAAPRRIHYWRLWVLNAVLVSAGTLFYLATHYGTYEFFGTACLMALLPLIPVLVLVSGAGSTLFVLTKVLIEKRSLKTPAALALLVGPGLLLTLSLVLLGAGRAPAHRLAYICLGNAPAAATHVRVAGYSTFLREEWLAVFNVAPKDFQAMVAGAQMIPADSFDFTGLLAKSRLQKSTLLQGLPPPNALPCFKRVFKESEEHQRGGAYALFDPATATAIVFREYRD